MSGGNRLHPISNSFVIRPHMPNLEDFHGEILECYNCFLPDHRYSRATSGGRLVFEGGVRYSDAEYRSSHNFGIDITMAFTPLPPGMRFVRNVDITHDFSNFPAPEQIDTWTQWTHAPGTDWHPSDWSAFIRYGPIRQWEANALTAFSRAGSHGFEIRAEQPHFTPPVGLENSYHPSYWFLDYLQLFQWVKVGNEHGWITNADAGRIITRKLNQSITPAGNVNMRIRRGAFAWDPNWQHGPDYWPFEFSAYAHRFDGLPPIWPGSLPPFPFVFWIYDYSTTLGITLQNLESRVESPAEAGNVAVFPRGHIPHEDTLGPQNGIWGYRWISNKWKYAPWERYQNLTNPQRQAHPVQNKFVTVENKIHPVTNNFIVRPR